jgi:hypothetical protein
MLGHSTNLVSGGDARADCETSRLRAIVPSIEHKLCCGRSMWPVEVGGGRGGGSGCRRGGGGSVEERIFSGGGKDPQELGHDGRFDQLHA